MIQNRHHEQLYIVIAVYNRCRFTKNCLAHLQNQTVRQFRVVVVDDGSTDGTSEMIREEFPDVLVIPGNGSLWWTRATNLGIELALQNGATRIMTLNDDTVPAPDFIERMLAASADRPNALIGTSAVDINSGELIFGGSRMNWLAGSDYDLLRDPSNPRFGLVEVTHFPGRGLLIPRLVFDRIGLFDQKHLPHYGADIEFTLRARRNGYPIFCNYASRLGIYSDAIGNVHSRRRKSWKGYYQHLFHMKGASNLRAFSWYTLNGCPCWLLPISLSVGIARRVLGYPLDWLREIYAGWRQRHALYHRA